VFPVNNDGSNSPSTSTANAVVDDTALFDTVGDTVPDLVDEYPNVLTSIPPPATVLSDTVTAPLFDSFLTYTASNAPDDRVTSLPTNDTEPAGLSWNTYTRPVNTESDTVTDDDDDTFTESPVNGADTTEFVIDNGDDTQSTSVGDPNLKSPDTP
jgi:hypothetical protein